MHPPIFTQLNFRAYKLKRATHYITSDLLSMADEADDYRFLGREDIFAVVVGAISSLPDLCAAHSGRAWVTGDWRHLPDVGIAPLD